MSKKYNQAEEYRLRYHLFKQAGFSSSEAKRYQTHSSIKVDHLKLDNNGKVIKDDSFSRLSNQLKGYDPDDKIVKPLKGVQAVQPRKQSKTTIKRNERKRKRYHILKEAGYSSSEARRLSSRGYDVDNIKLNKDGSVNKDSEEFKVVTDHLKVDRKVKVYTEIAWTVENDTIYSRWGMLTQDDRFKDDTVALAKELEVRHNLSNDQAFYMLYYMTYNNKSYDSAVSELLSNRDFEIYDELKRQRLINNRQQLRKG